MVRPAATAGVMERFQISGPRYTSYPTADRFLDTFDADDYLRAASTLDGTPAEEQRRLSVYVHIPFCASLCYYCGCNKIVTRHHERAEPYLRYLAREAELQAASIGADRAVTQLHLGGGTPTFFSDDELRELMAMLRSRFRFAPGGECSIEVDPRTVDAGRLAALADLGFNRISFGVQDFDPAVQAAVHRLQPFEQVQSLMVQARRIGFDSINVDLIYGLPRQTPASFDTTLQQVQQLRPDRIALYAYAHLPERFKPQRRILAAELPAGADKVAMLTQSLAALQAAGYVYIGMDHFALPGDALAVAKREGRLQRNFQGYSTQPDCDLVGLGVSAIGRVGNSYSQNAKTLEAYCRLLDEGRLPVVRGLALDRDDQVRRAVIMAVMCQGEVLFDAIGLAWDLDFRRYFEAELEQLRALADQGLVLLDDESIRVTAAGWFVVRAVAMVFDRYLRGEQDAARYSRIV